MSRRTPSLAALLVLAAAPLGAQSTAASASTAAPAQASSSQRPAPTPGALQAAEALLHAMNMEEVTRSGAAAMFDQQVKAQPGMAAFRPTMQAWLDKVMTWDNLGPQLARIYADEFSEAELRELLAFYQTPTGRKVAALSPLLSRRGAEAGAQLAQDHMAELQAMMMTRAAEIQKSGGATPNAPPAGATPP